MLKRCSGTSTGARQVTNPSCPLRVPTRGDAAATPTYSLPPCCSGDTNPAGLWTPWKAVMCQAEPLKRTEALRENALRMQSVLFCSAFCGP